MVTAHYKSVWNDVESSRYWKFRLMISVFFPSPIKRKKNR